jgi:hypothetical protein
LQKQGQKERRKEEHEVVFFNIKKIYIYIYIFYIENFLLPPIYSSSFLERRRESGGKGINGLLRWGNRWGKGEEKSEAASWGKRTNRLLPPIYLYTFYSSAPSEAALLPPFSLLLS